MPTAKRYYYAVYCGQCDLTTERKTNIRHSSLACKGAGQSLLFRPQSRNRSPPTRLAFLGREVGAVASDFAAGQNTTLSAAPTATPTA